MLDPLNHLMLLGVLLLIANAGDIAQGRCGYDHNRGVTRMTRLTVTDTWSITIDNHNNHCPEKWVVKPGGEKTPRGELSKPFEGWVHQGKYCGTLGQALRYIATQDVDGCVMTVVEYVDAVYGRIMTVADGVRVVE